MKLNHLVFALSLSVVFSAVADTLQDIFPDGKVSGNIGLGTLSGKTKERVYHPHEGGRKLSQLDWKYNNAAIVKGSLDWDVMPWISVGASGWTTIASRGSFMKNTDWIDKSKQEWTDQSKHPNTRLNFANEYDLSVKGWFLNEPDYRYGVMIGYQESRYSFQSTGGSFDHTIDGSIRQVASFPKNQKTIGYKQRYKMPYIGVVGNYRYEHFEFGAVAKYSKWGRVSDSDDHYNAGKTFKAKVKNQNYFSVAANAGYYVTPNAKVYVEGIWNRTTNKKGSLYINGYRHGSTYSGENLSGIENYNFITTVGVQYTF